MTLVSRTSLHILITSGLAIAGCQDDGNGSAADGTGTEATSTGDGDGDRTGDGDGDATGDGDGAPTGDGDGDTTGDGDGDTTGDGDGDGDGDTTGDGDGDGQGLCEGGCGAPSCGSCPDGPSLVVVGNYSIDSTEVSVADYAQFLDVEFSPQFLAELLPAGCEFKTDFTPDDWLVNPAATLPVVGVDWCDAAAYCAWAGKHMCGTIGGGAAELNDVQNPASNEWYRACSGGGISNFPYGLAYDPTACNTIDAGYAQLTDVGSLASCEGGYDGLFDMSGNVWEWTNACNDQDECRRRGGSYFSNNPNSRCGIDSLRPRDYREPSQGFRCCADI